jgi:hypothetical protein
MTHLPSPRGPEYIHDQGNCQVEDRGVWREEMGAPISKDHGTVTEEGNISLVPYIYIYMPFPLKGIHFFSTYYDRKPHTKQSKKYTLRSTQEQKQTQKLNNIEKENYPVHSTS